MPLVPPTFEELRQTGRREMESIGFNHWAEGSRIGAIVDIMAAYQQDLWAALADIEAQSNPTTARGIYLDRLGEMFGVRRLPPQTASTVGRGPAVKFTNLTAGPITISVGTRVWNSDDPDIAFFTIQDLAIAAGGEGFVDVVAGTAGEAYNIAANVLGRHNAGMGQASVTNTRPIGGGTFFESDEAFRFRISQALQSRNGATVVAIRQALLRLPGVRDAVIQSGVRGNGSLDMIVVPIDRYLSNDLLDACQRAVSDTVAAGISFRVLRPKTRRIDVTIQLRLIGGATLDQLRPEVEAQVRAYIDNLRINDGNGGSDLIFNELISRVQDASSNILDSVVNLTVDGVPSLQTNVTTNPGERLISGSVSIT